MTMRMHKSVSYKRSVKKLFTTVSLNLFSNKKNLTQKMATLLVLWVSPLLFISKEWAIFFRGENANVNKTFKDTKTLISNSYLIFACRVTIEITPTVPLILQHDIQGIRIKGKEMALVWHKKASRPALKTSSLLHTHSPLLQTHNIQSMKLQNNVVNYN